MQTIRLTLKTVTPLFLHGADNRGLAELRPPSIKGMMRFWLRALAGGIADLEKVRALEAQVFGSTEGGQGVTVRVEGTIPQVDPRPFLLPHKPDYGNTPSQKDRLRSPSPALKEGGEFTVVLIDRPGRDRSFLEAAAWSFWLAVNLGGFGQRARRGAGSLLLTKVEPAINGMRVRTDFADANVLKNCMENGLKAAKGLFAGLLPKSTGVTSPGIPKFPILSLSTAHIQIAVLTTSEEQQARAEVMRRIALFKNLVWGLPYLSPMSGETRITSRKVNNKYEPVRMASPVWFHLVPKVSEGFLLVQTQMKSEFPDGLDRCPDWEKICDYFNQCATNGAIDVSLP